MSSCVELETLLEDTVCRSRENTLLIPTHTKEGKHKKVLLFCKDAYFRCCEMVFSSVMTCWSCVHCQLNGDQNTQGIIHKHIIYI